MTYLQAVVHHLSMLAVMQAHQHEQLSEEVASLREQLVDRTLH